MSRTSAPDGAGRMLLVMEARTRLSARLQARRAEIESSIFERTLSYTSVPGAEAHEYVAGFRVAISSAVAYALRVLETGEESGTPIPPALFTQARLAARNGVTLDTVLRRYFAGYTLLIDFLMDEAEGDRSLDIDTLHRFGREQAAVFEVLVSAVTSEYEREAEEHPTSVAEQRLDRVRRLLAGEMLDTSQLRYGFEGWHLAVVATGERAASVIQGLGAQFGRQALLVTATDGTCWGWLGGESKFSTRELGEVASANWPATGIAAAGEPAVGLAGWRLTHRQARVALPFADERSGRLVRYSDFALLASIRQDELLRTSLHDLFLKPLAAERDGGEALKETLRAYFGAERNISSAAAVLGVSRRTVANRLHAFEARIGRPLVGFALEIEAALRLDELEVSI